VSNNFDPGVWWPRIDEKGIEMEMDMSWRLSRWLKDDLKLFLIFLIFNAIPIGQFIHNLFAMLKCSNTNDLEKEAHKGLSMGLKRLTQKDLWWATKKPHSHSQAKRWTRIICQEWEAKGLQDE
jgi:hypothetical protein